MCLFKVQLPLGEYAKCSLTTPPSILSLVVGKAHFKVNEPNMRMKSRLGVEPGPTFAGHLQPAPLIAYI